MMSSDVKKIVVAPLNWGLGHATRCIPLIGFLCRAGHDVLIASDGASLNLLKQEFSSLMHVELPSYNVDYNGRSMTWTMVKQLPKIRSAIRAEHDALRRILIDYNADLVISDNRYGCYTHVCPSVIMCHQINIPAGIWSPSLRKVHDLLLNKFNEVWIPDVDSEERLSGKLTKSLDSLNYRFVGIQSRFNKHIDRTVKDQITCILSGPEPHRSALEKVLVHELSEQPRPAIIVQGRVKGKSGTEVERINNLGIINYLTSHELKELIDESRYIICRSGYSSVMDLVQIGRTALLVPTPGQPEQEYLARYLQSRGWVGYQDQSELSVAKYIDGDLDQQWPAMKSVTWQQTWAEFWQDVREHKNGMNN